jgi:hypothetical protein
MTKLLKWLNHRLIEIKDLCESRIGAHIRNKT